MRRIICVLAFLLSLFYTPQLLAQCNTAPDAVNDSVKADLTAVLVDVLANDKDPEGHALTVGVTGHTCNATVTVDDFQLLELTPTPVLTSDCTITYQATDELGLADSATVAVTFVTEIFSDGFESGNASAWSATEP